VGGWPGDGLVLYVLELAECVRHTRLAGTIGDGFGVGDGCRSWSWLSV
jgi:hypothetical protein